MTVPSSSSSTTGESLNGALAQAAEPCGQGPVLVWISDSTGACTSFNDAWLQYSGRSLVEELGEGWVQGIHPEDYARCLATYLQALQARQTFSMEYRYRRHDGQYRWLLDLGVPRFSDDAEFLGYIGSCVEIGSKPICDTIARAALPKSKSELPTRVLEAKNKELEAILHVASHDLRSPLVNIQGFGQELERACRDMRELLDNDFDPLQTPRKLLALLEDDIAESLHYIQTSAVKMDALLSGLLRLSRLNRAPLTLKPLQGDQLLQGVLAAMEHQFHVAAVQTAIKPLPNCFGDAGQLNQLFTNLVDNAVKYLDVGRAGRIEITGSEEGEQVVYCVQDNGMGIPAQHQARVYEMFHRLQPDHCPGEGLGLTIAQSIAARHGGKIWVESTPNQGSSFFVSLPRIPDREQSNETERCDLPRRG